MALPSNWTLVTVQARFLNLDGTAMSGRVTFTPSASVLLNAAARDIIGGSMLAAPLDNTGFFSIGIPATDDPDINPTGFTYSVVEPTGRRYNIVVPVVADTIDLVDVVPNVDANPGTVQIVSGGGGAPSGGAGGVLSGTYPNPGFAVDMATQGELDTLTAAVGLKAPAASPTFTGTVSGPRFITPPVTVSYASTITPNAAAGSLFRCVATGNLTLAEPINGVDGQHIRVVVTASGADRTLSFAGGPTAVVIPAGERWAGLLIYDSGDWLILD